MTMRRPRGGRDCEEAIAFLLAKPVAIFDHIFGIWGRGSVLLKMSPGRPHPGGLRPEPKPSSARSMGGDH